MTSAYSGSISIGYARRAICRGDQRRGSRITAGIPNAFSQATAIARR
jgi:hypothetical protein